MRNWWTNLQANAWLTRKLMMLAILVGVGAAAFFMGRRQNVNATPPVAATPNATTEGYERRPVAYIYDNNMAVTRAELGEYLIARFGAERLDFLVNRKIVELECQKYHIYATDAEVEHRFQQDLASFGTKLTEHDFVNNILRRFGKTLYEWKEDVIRPKIMMEKLVKGKVQITDKDLHEGFEARYGPKIECRMIVLDNKDRSRAVLDVYETVRKGRAEFLVEAGKQFIPNLAQTQGTVPAIHKHFGDKKIEEIAFGLKVGEVSMPIEMPDKTYVILLCEKHLPADTKVRFEDERMKLTREMFDLRLAQAIPEEFAKIREAAKPRLLLSNQEPRNLLPATSGAYPTSTSPQAAPASVAPPLNPAPVATPDGYTPLSVPNAPLAPPSGIAAPPLPTFTPPAESK